MSKIDNSTDKSNSTPMRANDIVITSNNAQKKDNSTTSEGFVHESHKSTLKTQFEQNIGVEEGQLKKELNFNSQIYLLDSNNDALESLQKKYGS